VKNEYEVMLLKAYGAVQLNYILDVNYSMDNPKLALGKYFNAVFGLHFDLLEL